MDTLKIEMEIGDRKFRAEGPAEMVREQANAFMKLTVGGNAESIAAAEAAAVAAREAAEAEARAAAEKAKQPQPIPLEKIMKVSKTAVWLTTPTDSTREALLVMLLGHRQLRNAVVVPAIDLLRGARWSGHRVHRLDSFFRTLERNKQIIREGRRRQTRYQLTERGAARAEQLARDFINRLPPPNVQRSEPPGPATTEAKAKAASKG